MNILFYLVVSLVAFFLAYRFYAGRIERMFGASNEHEVPAVAYYDGVDYVPTRLPVLFSHHFASIAGAGPIIGPVVALIYGFAPAWLWIVAGTVFFGAVHDYAALFVSMREKGRSMAEVARTSMGKAGFILFILFTLTMIFLVTGAFLRITATALTSVVDLKVLGLDSSQTILRTVTDAETGTTRGAIGGIASTSVIFITLMAPLVGYLFYKLKVRTAVVTLLAVAICFFSIVLGFKYPLAISPTHWMLLLSFYALLAAGLPIWVVLQPRDFTNSFILYAGIILLTISIAVGGMAGVEVRAPLWNVNFGTAKLGLIWPVLFITIACGAISGFHALVSGGTTAKQCASESDAKKIGYGAMLLEGLLAVIVLVIVAGGLPYREYLAVVFPDASGASSNPVLAFALATGRLTHGSLGVPVYLGTIFGILLVEGFLATTLDTAVRLNRYLFEELWKEIFKTVPRLLRSYLFNAGVSVIIMYALAYKQAFFILWPVFGTANQLLAGLTLTVVSVWFVRRGRGISPITVLPALFMMATTIFSLFYLLVKKGGYLATGNYLLILAVLCLIALAAGVVFVAFQNLRDRVREPERPVPDAPGR